MTKAFNNVGIVDLRDRNEYTEEINIQNAGIVIIHENEDFPENVKIQNIGNLIKADHKLSIIKSEFYIDNDFCENTSTRKSFLITGTINVDVKDENLNLLKNRIDKIFNFGNIICENEETINIIKEKIEINTGDIVNKNSNNVVLNGRVSINEDLLKKYNGNFKLNINGMAEILDDIPKDNSNISFKINGKLVATEKNYELIKRNIDGSSNFVSVIIPDGYYLVKDEFIIDNRNISNFYNKNTFFNDSIMFDENISKEEAGMLGDVIFNDKLFIKKEIFEFLKLKIKCDDIIFYNEAINIDGYKEIESSIFFMDFNNKKDLFITGNLEWNLDYKDTETLFKEKINNIFNFGIINVKNKKCKDIFYLRTKINEGIISLDDENIERTDVYYLRI